MYQYKPGRTNLVADALSRKAELVSLKLQENTAVSQFRSTLSDRIKEGLQHDAVARSLLQAVKEGRTRRFWEKDGLLYTKGNKLFVPRWDNIRRDLLKECHDTRWAGHPGQHRTMALLGARFYWPQMKEDVESYVQTCLVCQQDKIEDKRPGGERHPLPILTRPWQSVTMDFISCLPRVDGLGSIMVVVDRFSKYATFMAASADCTADEAARLFMKNVVKYWGCA